MVNRSRVFAICALACVISASACKDNSGIDPIGGVVGTYTLTTANGQLPLRYVRNDTTVDIVSGTLRLTRTGGFEEILNYHVMPPTTAAYDVSPTTNGTYMVEGQDITFTYFPGPGQQYSWFGTVASGIVTYKDPSFVDLGADGLTAVYSK